MMKGSKNIIQLIFNHLVDMPVHHFHREAGFGHNHAQGFFHRLVVGFFRHHHIEAQFLEEGAPVGELLVENHQSAGNPDGRFAEGPCQAQIHQ